MHHVLNNSAYVKVNFHSDAQVAHRINEAGRRLEKPPPLVTSLLQMGGYTFPVLNLIAGGRAYQVLKAPLPQNSRSNEEQINKIMLDIETVYAYVDGGEVTITQIQGYDRNATPLGSFGWNVLSRPKTFKRLKTLNRPFRLYDIMDRPLRVLVVEDDAYSNMTGAELSEYSSAEVERLLDGAFVISRELFTNCLGNVYFPEVTNENDMRPEFMVDFYRSQEYFRQAQFFHALNARIFGPMELINISENDDLYGRVGQLKGEAFIDISDHCINMGVDIICTRSALKFEVSNDRDTIILLEPQKAKLSGVNSDLQTMVNLPAIYQFDQVKNWTREYLLAMFDKLCKDEIMESWFDMSNPMFNTSRFFDHNDVTSLTKWNARAWLLSGMRITQSPWLFEQLGIAISKTLKSLDQSKLKFPVPCAVRAQVISQSFAAMAGYDVRVIEGSIHWAAPLESLVVNDRDWIEMYHSHGGHDLDDFFVGYWRTIVNSRKIIIVRSPNDWGEYSVFDYVEGDWYPTFEGYQGNFIIFPEISADAEMWPQRLSEMVREGKIHYTGLPSENNPPPPNPTGPYGTMDVVRLMRNNKSSGSCVGASVNARILHSLSMKKHRDVQLTSMEKCIDTGTQGGSLADAEAVMAESKEIVQQIISDSTLEIDEYLWITRFSTINGIPFSASRLTSDTHISQAHRFRLDATRSFMIKVRDYAQKKLTTNIDPRIHALGKRYLKVAYRILTETRYQMVQMQNPGVQDLAVSDWGSVHSLILAKIESYENIVDKHDFMLAFYSVNMKIPTARSKKITDQLVMNPHIFPYLLEALRFYGIASYITLSPEGVIGRNKLESWTLECLNCGKQAEVQDPVEVQSYHHHKQLCKTCRSVAA